MSARDGRLAHQTCPPRSNWKCMWMRRGSWISSSAPTRYRLTSGNGYALYSLFRGTAAQPSHRKRGEVVGSLTKRSAECSNFRRHDMALALQRAKFESQTGPQGVGRWNKVLR